MHDFTIMERTVIGACIRNTGFRYEAFESLTIQHFEDSNLRALYQCILSMAKKSEDITIDKVATRFSVMADLPTNIAIDLCISCYESSVTLYAEEYVEKLKERSIRKKLVGLSLDIHHKCEDYSRSLPEIIDNIKKTIATISLDKTNTVLSTEESMNNHQGGKSFEENLEERIRLRKSGTQPFVGIPYKIPTLDKVTGGIRAGSLVLLAARTSMGKTEFAINLMRNWMTEGVPIGMFSMEMPLYQIDNRMIAQKACMSVDDIESADLDDEMKFRILESAKWHRKTKLCYDQTSGLTPQQLKARIYYMQQRHEAKVIIVDFLTLMKPNYKTNTSHEKFTHIVQEIQNIAKELNIPILMIAQLNRDSAREGGRRPSLVDIRESGAIEEAIDVALFLHRRDYYDPMDKPGEVELIVDKNRHTGKRQVINMSFNKRESRFLEIDYSRKEEVEVHEDIQKLFMKR